jgi:uncharacterized protein (TIGR03032 family)
MAPVEKAQFSITMNSKGDSMRDDMWTHHNERFRDPADIVAFWQGPHDLDPRLFEYETVGDWWEIVRRLNITLIVTREYEHIVLALHAGGDAEPRITFIRLPHPSGIAVDRSREVVYIASTRNPNAIYDLKPLKSLIPRLDAECRKIEGNPLIPVRSRFMPGCTYLHDLAMLGGELYATSVGQNAIIRLYSSGDYERVWWPRCIETPDGPIFGQNHLQLNSIAAGKSLESSFFSASTDEMTDLRPGDPKFPVDKRGVIFSGETREAIARGLTRPHSARFHNGRVWVEDSGYGEVGYVDDGTFNSIVRLPGWTRGLCFYRDIMFAGTSIVLPRFRQYAPGLDLDASRCGLHALDANSGKLLGSIFWPRGSQIFAIDWMPVELTHGLPFRPDGKESKDRDSSLFYAFQVGNQKEG